MYPKVGWLKQPLLSWVYKYKMKWSHRSLGPHAICQQSSKETNVYFYE